MSFLDSATAVWRPDLTGDISLPSARVAVCKRKSIYREHLNYKPQLQGDQHGNRLFLKRDSKMGLQLEAGDDVDERPLHFSAT